MQNDKYLSLTQLGVLYGVSSHKVGRWLKDLDLRTDVGKPSRTAFREGFVEQCPSTQPGTFFYVWNRAKVTEILDAMGYPRKAT